MSFSLGPKAAAGGYRLAAYDTIGSTSAEALARAKAGDPGRLWVVSKAQTAGHGRRGRPWQTPTGNLAASLLLPGPVSPGHAAKLGFAAGLALEHVLRTSKGAASPGPGEAESERSEEPGEGSHGLAEPGNPHPVAGATGPLPFRERKGVSGPALRIQLKWPNDVLLDGAKLAGILLEAITIPGGGSRVVIGIGLNVRHAPAGLPYRATSLVECGVDVTAEDVFEALSDAWLDQEIEWDEGRGFPKVRRQWLERAAGLGAPIAVQVGGEMFRGTFDTIDEEGRLIVRTHNGSARVVTAGEVHFGEAATAGR